MDDLSFGADEKIKISVTHAHTGSFDEFLAPRGAHLWTILRKRGHLTAGGCSGVGGCGRCACRVASGEVSPAGQAEREALERLGMREPTRLSCHIFADRDCVITVGDIE